VGSKTFDGVWFIAFTKDHLPAHVHGRYSGTTVILELDFTTSTIRLADRPDRITPRNAKRSDVTRIRRVAEQHGEELFKLWEAARS
jgi:hypothetical protein